MNTFEEMCVKLVVHSEIEDVIDLLQLATEDILGRFEDRVEENRDKIEEFLDEPAR
jgi:hypothetical protein